MAAPDLLSVCYQPCHDCISENSLGRLVPENVQWILTLTDAGLVCKNMLKEPVNGTNT